MTKEELEAALKIKKKLDRLEAKLADIEATGGIRTSLQSAGGRGGEVKDAAQDAAELREAIAETKRKLEIEQEIIRRAIEKALMTEEEREFMIEHYVNCKVWRRISTTKAKCKTCTYDIRKSAVMKMINFGH